MPKFIRRGAGVAGLKVTRILVPLDFSEESSRALAFFAMPVLWQPHCFNVYDFDAANSKHINKAPGTAL